jgi:hypothetical protein
MDFGEGVVTVDSAPPVGADVARPVWEDLQLAFAAATAAHALQLGHCSITRL